MNNFFCGKWVEEEFIEENSYSKIYRVRKEDNAKIHSSVIQVLIFQNQEDDLKKWIENLEFLKNFNKTSNVVKVEEYEVLKNEYGTCCTINIRTEVLQSTQKYFSNSNNITDKHVLKMVIDTATAVGTCERNNINAGEIKLENIFVNNSGMYKLGMFVVANRQNEKPYTYLLGEILYRYFGDTQKNIYDIILRTCNNLENKFDNVFQMRQELGNIYYRITNTKLLLDLGERPVPTVEIPMSNEISKEEQITEIIGESIEEHDVIKENSEDNQENVYELPKALCEKLVEESESEEPIQSLVEESESEEPIQSLVEESESEEPIQNLIEGTKSKEEIQNFVEEVKVEEFNIKKEQVEKAEQEISVPIINDVQDDDSIITETKNEGIKQNIESEYKQKSATQGTINKKKLAIVAVLVILLIIAIIVFCIIKFRTKPETVQPTLMPQLVGMQQDEAEQKLEELELKYKYEYEETENEEEIGKVIEQSIAENTEIEKGVEILIKVATAKSKITMINVEGMTLEEAKVVLENLGLQIDILEQNSEDIEQGRVISQVPKEGEEIEKNGIVNLIISLGKEESEEEEKEQTQPTSIVNQNNNNQTSIQSNNSESNNTQQQTQQENQLTQQPTGPDPTSIRVSCPSKFISKETASMKATATVLPEDANNKTVVWTSNNTSRATVTQDGEIKPVGEGSVIITATISGTNISQSFEIIVWGSNMGDLSGDGYVNANDAAMILDIVSHNTNPTEDQLSRADINRDGKITREDADLVLEMYSRGVY